MGLEQDEPEHRDELDGVRVEAQREPAEVRAREQPDDHVDGDRGQPDPATEPTEHVGDDEERAEGDEHLAEVHP